MDMMEPIFFTPPPVRGRYIHGLWMKDSPQAPAAPDPVATANAQTASNTQTALANAKLNNVNQVNPYGRLTYTSTTQGDKFDQAGYDAAMAKYNQQKSAIQAGGVGKNGTPSIAQTPTAKDPNAPVSQAPNANLKDGGTPQAQDPLSALSMPTRDQYTTKSDGIPTYTATTTLAPAQQKLLDSSNAISQGMADAGQTQLGQVQNTLANPVDFSKITQLQNGQLNSGVTPGQVQSSISPAGGIQNSIDTSNLTPLQTGINTSNLSPLQTSAGAAATANGVSRNGVTPLVGGDALGKAMTDAQQASYQNQTQYLDPQWQQQTHDLQNQLTQQGVMQNSDAWNRAVNNQNLQKQSAYTNAYNNSVGLGNAAEAQLYGQGLSTNQNAFSQNQADASVANQAAQINNQQALANAQLANNANAQQFGQNSTTAAFQNSANAQQYSQNANNANFANSAQNQLYGQNSNNAAFANNAQNQIFGQGLNNAQLQNSAAGQGFAQSVTGQNQDMNVLLQQQNNPLNVLNALRTGSQVQNPTFGATPTTNVAGTNVAGIIGNNYANQMGQYNAQVQSNNSITSGLFGLGAAALMAPAGGLLSGAAAAAPAAAGAGYMGGMTGSAALLSDRRTKTEINRIGATSGGIPIYTFQYKPEFVHIGGTGLHVGVMADEVEPTIPDAVITRDDGYKMVDYGRIA